MMPEQRPEKIPHPSRFVDVATARLIRDWAPAAEAGGDLHESQWALVFRERWLKMFVPVDYGGLGYSLTRVLQTEEGLSWADGSVGWVVTLCSGAGWFSGFLQPALAKEVFFLSDVCVAGSGAATGEANLRDGSYEVKGRWKYASGALKATHFTANCKIFAGGEPVLNADGSQRISAFLFYEHEVTVLRTWNAMGLKATGSHSFAVNQLAIPEERCFSIGRDTVTHADPVYVYPFQQLAETTLVVNLSGMACRFIDCCAARTDARDNALAAAVRRAQLETETCRSAFYEAVAVSIRALDRGGAIPPECLTAVTEASMGLATVCKDVVGELYLKAGLSAAGEDQELNRVYRNFFTASQHALFRW